MLLPEIVFNGTKTDAAQCFENCKHLVYFLFSPRHSSHTTFTFFPDYPRDGAPSTLVLGRRNGKLEDIAPHRGTCCRLTHLRYETKPSKESI
ncbi:hypothetical protein IscW_ISCW005774 [Ixodes scapularis]|uniref:Uncharacterized protein n=1 Tax=Ixodes scapularis TaxID=6945 RepID=B7PNL4_IXOSC|nr:hypothetical protein IscW_ISCW005774 [Ixodes scapularis]|eukprot:XP_002435362.1 hypothetical protein IscW_ISCW005774 [Ixodes scapularis]